MALNFDSLVEWINGSTGSTVELREKLESQERELTGWREKLKQLEARNEQADVDLADEKVLARIATDIRGASSRIKGLTRRIEKTRELLQAAEATERSEAERKAKADLHTELEQFEREMFYPCVSRSAELLRRAERVGVGEGITGLLDLQARFMLERVPGFRAAMAELVRKPSSVAPAPKPSTPQAHREPPPRMLDSGGPVVHRGDPRVVEELEIVQRPTPLPPAPTGAVAPGMARVKTLRSGYLGLPMGAIVDVALYDARQAKRNGAIDILEEAPPLAVNPTEVAGAHWEKSGDARTINPSTGDVT
jgi:hypothetical protein